MNDKWRAVLAVIGGLVAAVVAIVVVESLSPYAPPSDIDVSDRHALGAWLGSLPWTAFALILLAYLMGAVVGGYATNRLAASTPYRPAMVTGFGLFVFGAMNLLAIPHPLWFVLVSSAIHFFGAWVGGRLASLSIRTPLNPL